MLLSHSWRVAPVLTQPTTPRFVEVVELSVTSARASVPPTVGLHQPAASAGR